MYKAKVKYNGNHYDAGQEVRGSKIAQYQDGTVELFDDEPLEEFPFYGEGRNEWVEVDKNTIFEFWYCINHYVEDAGYEPLLIGYNAIKVFETEEEAKDYALSHPDEVGVDYQISEIYGKVYHYMKEII